jgi:L-ribulose-5-phosphate 4-epimerase
VTTRQAPALPAAQITELNAWRKLMVLGELIGQAPNRYGGYGYGNISCRAGYVGARRWAAPFRHHRHADGRQGRLDGDDYVTVTACYATENRLVAEGPVKPSSEALTHGAVYALDSAILWVVHTHSPEIWHNAEALGVPMTANVPYGSPEMAAEVKRLYAESDLPESASLAWPGTRMASSAMAARRKRPASRCWPIWCARCRSAKGRTDHDLPSPSRHHR